MRRNCPVMGSVRVQLRVVVVGVVCGGVWWCVVVCAVWCGVCVWCVRCVCVVWCGVVRLAGFSPGYKKFPGLRRHSPPTHPSTLPIHPSHPPTVSHRYAHCTSTQKIPLKKILLLFISPALSIQRGYVPPLINIPPIAFRPAPLHPLSSLPPRILTLSLTQGSAPIVSLLLTVAPPVWPPSGPRQSLHHVSPRNLLLTLPPKSTFPHFSNSTHRIFPNFKPPRINSPYSHYTTRF